jgi:hypothetical protein
MNVIAPFRELQLGGLKKRNCPGVVAEAVIGNSTCSKR